MFHVLTPGAQQNPFDTEYLKTDDASFGPAPRCDACGAFVGMRVWLPPFRAELVLRGERWGDFAFFSLADFLLSNRAVALLSKMTGLSGFEEVEVVSVAGATGPPPSYHRAVVAFGGATLDENRSSIERSTSIRCVACRTSEIDAIRGFALERESWNGTAIFVPRGLPGVVVVTDSFRELVENAGLTNVEFSSTAEYHWDPSEAVSG